MKIPFPATSSEFIIKILAMAVSSPGLIVGISSLPVNIVDAMIGFSVFWGWGLGATYLLVNTEGCLR